MFAGFGCHSTPNGSYCNDGCENGCEDGSGHGPRRWSAEWYAMKGESPEGTRQLHKFGKTWPPYARPTGEGQEFSARFHDVHYWPHPYNCQDRGYLREVSAIQANSGWTTETTLYDYHFEKDNVHLNHSGMLHLKWILETIPQNRRFVWVQTADNRDSSESRLDNVKSAAKEIVGDANLPPIALRVASPSGRPTKEVDQIQTREFQSIPTPRVPLSSGASSSGSNSGSGGDSGGQGGTI